MTMSSHTVDSPRVTQDAPIPAEPTESSPLLCEHQAVPNLTSDEEAGATRPSSDDEQGGSSVTGLLSVLLIGMAHFFGHLSPLFLMELC
jgi:hypothetical protein